MYYLLLYYRSEAIKKQFYTVCNIIVLHSHSILFFVLLNKILCNIVYRMECVQYTECNRKT